MTWDLRVPLPSPGGPARPPGAAVPAGEDGAHAIVAAGPAGEPATGAEPRAEGTGPGLLRCWIPEDMLTVRRPDPALARRWRDRYLGFHLYDEVAPSPRIEGLLREIDRDPRQSSGDRQRPTARSGSHEMRAPQGPCLVA